MDKTEDAVLALLEDIGSTHGHLLQVVQRVRQVVEACCGPVAESVKYGGILFSRVAPFCGVYAYTGHVSVEFGQGYRFEDPHRVLEGSGKFRRHIKLRTLSDVQDKHLADYIRQALNHSLLELNT
ncbi:DUF1801 domain-containing protein [Pseudomonas chlororaphis]|uniref:DUF1801 domain-containing protein n=1 Tax=Pseudomonas chlororaphis TaxID=587753 RepID=UPI00209B4377|nr:DUF1801 domain-containing protein [Pseudomonas chlororaphis]MCO7610667.1 DUF1801 domain-containing protein [Pseudomonas chlororaphis]